MHTPSMTNRVWRGTFSAALAGLALVACDDSPTMSEAQSEAALLGFGEVMADMNDDARKGHAGFQGGPRACPGGGTVEYTRESNETVSADGSIIDRTYSGQVVHNNCVLEGRDGSGQVTLNGFRNTTGVVHLVNLEPVGPQTRAWSGSMTRTDADGVSNTCDFDLSAVYDPVAGTVTIEGTMCGEAVSKVHERGNRTIGGSR